ncbi:MAG: rSAM/selenodomain-associated transferase 2 [Candidatus Azotimanducaceae bacterium]|jgi:rSAM/selenodomain-associated transferase 2
MSQKKRISIIIPCLNEEESIEELVAYLTRYGADTVLEIIVVDGQSQDNTLCNAKKAGAICYASPKVGRSAQMNYGVQKANGDIYYFVHADSIPPQTFASDILKQIEAGVPIGCFRFRFDSDKWTLKINSYFTRFDKIWCRGGDQTLFITKNAWDSLQGFKDFKVMEEYDLIERAKKKYRFVIIPKNTIVSPRKYQFNSYFRVNFANLVLFLMYRYKVPQDRMVNVYKTLIKHPKA